MLIESVGFYWKLESIELFLTRALKVYDEYARILNGENVSGWDFNYDDAVDAAILEQEHAVSVIRSYQDIVLRAALGELNALVELELTNLARSIRKEQAEPGSRRSMDRSTARRLIEEHYQISLNDLAKSTEVDELRQVVNAFKHRDGLTGEYKELPGGIELEQKHELDLEQAFHYLAAVTDFLLSLPGQRTGRRPPHLRFAAQSVGAVDHRSSAS